MSITPLMGRKDRQFDQVWQAVRYQVGYGAHDLGLDGPSYEDRFYRMGWQDAQAEALAKKEGVAA